MLDGLYEKAVRDIAWDYSRTGLAPLEQTIARGHREAAERRGGMATEAAVSEQWTNLELKLLSGIGLRGKCRECDEDHCDMHV